MTSCGGRLQVSVLRYRDLVVWKGVFRGTGVSRPEAFEQIGEHALLADGRWANAVFAGRKMVADVFSSAGRGYRAPSSAAGKAHGGNSTPDQASRVDSGDRGGNMEARAGGCVEQCTGPGDQRRRFVVSEGRV